ncbi:hypothetical protein POM88_046241 [Heracleum sosnowskyi]|uniref:Uncharacterized protein n=1 Tax=Heracleum sosnowskyi TaxID=360622 RepID=A0AAD8H8Z5_9APIA|nr:hypothetical protein POM88_046241 [Heracleum sosnowskyi]
MIRPNGSQGWNNSLTWPLLNCRKCHWLPFISNEKPTNGGNGLKDLTRKRKRRFPGKVLKKSSGPDLVQQNGRTFMNCCQSFGGHIYGGGLKPELADGIRMFKPKSLKEAINLARMKDDQVRRQSKYSLQNNEIVADTSSSIVKTTSP